MAEKKKTDKNRQIKSNPKINEIVKDFPEQLKAYPRSSFENQLKEHLVKHGVK